MKTTAPKKAKVSATDPVAETKIKVELPPTFKARVNQMAHRKGKAHADMWRTITMVALQGMADEGAPLDELSKALAGIEANPPAEDQAEVDDAMAKLKGK